MSSLIYQILVKFDKLELIVYVLVWEKGRIIEYVLCRF